MFFCLSIHLLTIGFHDYNLSERTIDIGSLMMGYTDIGSFYSQLFPRKIDTLNFACSISDGLKRNGWKSFGQNKNRFCFSTEAMKWLSTSYYKHETWCDVLCSIMKHNGNSLMMRDCFSSYGMDHKHHENQIVEEYV